MQSDNIFIAIEGTSQVNNQLTLLKKHLEYAGFEVVVFNFPRIKHPSGFFVQQLQKGYYGSPNAYTRSLFFSIDRYHTATAIRAALHDGKIVIATNFTGATMAEQGISFEHPEERRGFFIWLDNLEYELFKIPRPLKTFVLRSATKKSNPIDEIFDDLCQLFPKDFERIDTVRNNTQMPSEVLHKIIWEKIEPILPHQTHQTAVVHTHDTQPAHTSLKHQVLQLKELSDLAIRTICSSSTLSFNEEENNPLRYYVPRHLSEKNVSIYKKTMDTLISNYYKLLQDLSKFTHLSLNQTEVKQAANRVLPVAVMNNLTCNLTANSVKPLLDHLQNKIFLPEIKTLHARLRSDTNQSFTKHASDSLPKSDVTAIVAKILPTNHSDYASGAVLYNFWPRNEFDIVPDILYEHCDYSYKDISIFSDRLNYAVRKNVIKTYFESGDERVLEKLHYQWDIVCPYLLLSELEAFKFIEAMRWQPLTPRFGYKVPQIIEQAGLSDLFEECFDLSLHLYSVLQAEGYKIEAQYAVLKGHNMRLSFTANARTMRHMFHASGSNAYKELAIQLQEGLSQVHPIIAEYL